MLALIELENELWTPQVGADINPKTAEKYKVIQSPGSLSLMMYSDIPYSGWLAKNVQPLPQQSTRILFDYEVMTDDATGQCGQVIETDMKATDTQSFTYDGSSQWNLEKGGMFQIGNPWKDTGIVFGAFKPYVPTPVTIEYAMEWGKGLNYVSVMAGGIKWPIPTALQFVPVKQTGWDKSQIVTQLQQCNNANGGGYTLRFSKIGYRLKGDVN